MSDCQSIDVRDRLPEYLHGRLNDAERREVEEHLAACDDCRAELATLRSVRLAFEQTTPVINVAAIVRSLPRPVRSTRRIARSRVLQLAAAISFVSIGGMSLVMARSFFDNSARSTIDSAAATRRIDSAVSAIAGSGSSVSAKPVGLTVGGGVADLEADELEQLLGTLESIEALPSADPDESIAQILPGTAGMR